MAEKLRVFISYQRKNVEFATQLWEALTGQGYEVWQDIKSLKAEENWWQAICEGIDQSDVVLQVISPTFLTSKVCNWEMWYARDKSKRTIPLWYIDVYQDSEGVLGKLGTFNFDDHVQENVPDLPDLPITAKENWALLKYKNAVHINEETFDGGLAKLIQALGQDVEHMRAHTRLLEQARRWERNGENASYHIRGQELENALRWLASSANKDPEIDDLHQRFIEASRVAKQNRQRYERLALMSLGIVGIVVAVVMTFLAINAIEARDAEEIARIEAVNQRDIAATQQSIAVNRLQNQIQLLNTSESEAGRNPGVPIRAGLELWVTNRDADTLTRFAADTGENLGAIQVGENPLEAVYDGEFVWTASPQTRQLYRIHPDLPDSPLIVDLPAAPRAFQLAGNWLWVRADGGALLIERSTGRIVGNIPTPVSLDYLAVAGETLWGAAASGDTLYRLTPTTTTPGTFPVGAQVSGIFIAGERVWATEAGGENRLFSTLTDLPGTLTALRLPGRVTAFTSDGSRLWVVATEAVVATGEGAQTLLTLDTQTGGVRTQRALTPESGLLARLWFHDGRLWGYSDTDLVLSLDADTLNPLTTTALADTASFSPPTFTETHVWIADRETNLLHGLNRESGVSERGLPLCEAPAQPLYDGVNLWVSCLFAGQMARVPANLYYHGSGEGQVWAINEFERNVRAHIPIFDGRRLWIVHEPSGDLLIHDTVQQCTVDVIPLGQYPALPIYDPVTGDYWIEQERVDGTFHLIYLNSDDPALDTCNTTLIPESVALPFAPNQMVRSGDYLWIVAASDNIARIEAGEQPTPEETNLHIVSLAERRLMYSLKVGMVMPMEVVPISATQALIATMDDTTGGLYIVDAVTGDIREAARLDYTPTLPVFTASGLWMGGRFRGGAFQAYTAIEGFGDDGSASNGALIRLNADTYTQELLSESIFSPSDILDGGRFLWVAYTDQPTVVTAAYNRGYNALAAIDPQTGETVQEYRPCDNLLPPFYDAETGLVWVTCWGLADDPGDVWVIDGQSGAVIFQYEDLGREAWQPVKEGETLWLTYRGTANVAVFCETGELLRVYGVGAAPMPPVIDTEGGRAWIANSGSATIQSIELHDLYPQGGC